MSKDPSSAEIRIAELELRVERLTIALRDLISHGSHLNAEQRASLDRAREALKAPPLGQLTIDET